MKRLILLRHAKAVAKDAAADSERTLAPRGRAQLTLVARYLADEALVPDLALVSTAARTRETWELASVALPTVAVSFDERIYEASADALLAVVGSVPAEAGTVCLVGHNPGLHDLARQLVGLGDRHGATRAMRDLPTASIAVLDFPVERWDEVRFGSGRLDRFVTPEDLGFTHGD